MTTTRINRFVCIIMDGSHKLDLYRDEKSNSTPLFDSAEEVRNFMKAKNIDEYTIVQVTDDTFETDEFCH